MVAGRALQGLGGGGLVPVTLGLVADVWPAERRGVPLGVIGAVQELGSVLGPLYGGLILTVATWQTIFWLNLPIAAVLGIGLYAAGRGTPRLPGPARAGATIDRVSIALAVVALAAGCLAIVAPDALQNSDTIGVAYSALGGLVWLTPLGGGRGRGRPRAAALGAPARADRPGRSSPSAGSRRLRRRLTGREPRCSASRSRR